MRSSLPCDNPTNHFRYRTSDNIVLRENPRLQKKPHNQHWACYRFLQHKKKTAIANTVMNKVAFQRLGRRYKSITYGENVSSAAITSSGV